MISRWVAIAAIVGFSSGTGVACEADHQAMQKTSLLPAVHSIANDKDALSLTSAQQRTAWESISRHGTIQFAASSFTTSVSVGATLPASITPHIFPAEAVARVPGLRRALGPEPDGLRRRLGNRARPRDARRDRAAP